MMPKDSFEINLIVRFLMSDATVEDIQLLERWILSDPKNKQYFEEIRDVWNGIQLKKELTEKLVQSDLKNVLNRIERKNANGLSASGKRKIGRPWILRIAAILVLGFGLSLYLGQTRFSESKDRMAFTTIETPKGSSTVVNLPDGSKVMMNAESKLKYPMSFTESERVVFFGRRGIFRYF